MSQNYKANPTVAPLISRPGESSEYVGARSVMNYCLIFLILRLIKSS